MSVKGFILICLVSAPIYGLLTECNVKMARQLAKFFLREEVEVCRLTKRKTPISSHLG